MAEERLLKLPEVADRLSASRSTIYRLIARGELTPVRIGRGLRFSEVAISRIMLGQMTKEERHAEAA